MQTNHTKLSGSSPIPTRCDGTIIIEVVNGNLNGDPDNDGASRQCPLTGHGLATGVMIKRRIRDYAAAVHGQEIHIRRDSTIEQGILDALATTSVTQDEEVEAAEPESGDGKRRRGARPATPAKKLTSDDRQTVTAAACEKFFDDRMFGCVLNVGKAKANNISGAVTFYMARSIDPITINKLAITRVCAANERQEKDQEMGAYYVVPHAVYRMDFTVNAPRAMQNGATMHDLAIMMDAIVHAFDASSSSHGGEINVRQLWLFQHDSPFGSIQRHRLMERVKVTAGPSPKSWSDYSITFDAAGLAGVTPYSIESFLGGKDKILETLLGGVGA